MLSMGRKHNQELYTIMYIMKLCTELYIEMVRDYVRKIWIMLVFVVPVFHQTLHEKQKS